MFDHDDESGHLFVEKDNTEEAPGKAMHVPEDWNWLRDPDGSSSVSSRELSLTDDWFARFRDLEALFALRQLKPGDTGRVRVAVIDTGIDMGHIAIQAAVENGQIARVCDWVDGREGIEDEKIGDSEGHGTYIASVILDMAPHVDLYIARVSKQRVLSDREAENIAKVRVFILTSTLPSKYYTASSYSTSPGYLYCCLKLGM